MAGRHKAGPAKAAEATARSSHRRARKRPIALPSMLMLGIAAAAAVVLRGPLGGPDDAGGAANSNAASALTLPRPAPEVTEPPVAATPAPAAASQAAPSRSPRPAQPTRAATKRPSRSNDRAAASRCPVVDNARSHPNGQVPESHLCDLPQQGHRMHGDAADAFWRMDAAYRKEFGEQMCVSSSYRSFAEQADLHEAKPVLAAKPGTSNHGWGLAVDLCEGPDKFGTREYEWLRANAGDFDFENPSWARQGGSKPEPWHWEYIG